MDYYDHVVALAGYGCSMVLPHPNPPCQLFGMRFRLVHWSLTSTMHAWDDRLVHVSGGQALWYEYYFKTTSVLVTLAYKTHGAWR